MKTDTTRHDIAALSEARAEAIRDSDSFAEWLSVVCARQPVSMWQPVLREKTAEDFETWKEADLVSLMVDAGQPATTRCAALDVIVDRYCATKAMQNYIDERAGFLAVQMAASEREVA